MAKAGLVNITTDNTFQVWLDRTNEIIDITRTDTLTASSLGDTTGSIQSPKNATLIGAFTANTVTAETELRTDSITSTGTDITLNSPVLIDTSQRVGFESFSNSADPVLRVNNGSVAWDMGFSSTNNDFIINNGSATPRLNLTSTGDLTVAGNILSDITGGVTGDVTGNLTGDVTGDVIGDVTGNLTGNVTGNLTGNVTGNASSASKLQTPRNITLSGAVTGSASFDGSSNITISATATSDPTLTITGDATGSTTFTNLNNATLSLAVADNSHRHTISNITGLSEALGTAASSSGVKGFITFDGLTAVVKSSKNLSITKLSTGNYRINVSSSIRTGSANFNILVTANGSPRVFQDYDVESAALQVYHTWVSGVTSTYFDIKSTRAVNDWFSGGEINKLGPLRSDDASIYQMFRIDQTDPRYITVLVVG